MATDDFARLCALIDQDDDSVLPILADLLEERGDPRAAGVRAAWPHKPLDSGCIGRFDRYQWHPSMIAGGYAMHRWYNFVGPPVPWSLPQQAFDKVEKSGGHAIYASRSAAYLAMAEALAKEPTRS